MVNYKVISEDEWKKAAKEPPKPKRGKKKMVLLRNEAGTKFYGREP